MSCGAHSCIDQPLLGDVIACEGLDDRSSRHDEHAVAEPLELLGVRRRHDHRHAALGNLAQDAIDLRASTHVYALGRLVGNHDGRLGQEEVLLALIAAGLGATALTYSVLGDYRITLVGVLITFALLVQFAGFLVDLERGRAEEETVAGGWMLRTVVLHRRRLIEVLVDFVLISAAFTAAYLLVVKGTGTTYERHVFTVALPAVLVTRYVAFILLGLYQGIWRFAGSREAASIIFGVVVSELAAFGIVVATTPLGSFPVTVFVLDAFLCMAVIGASRFAERGLFRARSTLRDRDAHRTLIVGAGRSGRSLLRELRETPGERVVGFVDDDPRLHRRRLLGVVVRGGTLDMERILGTTKPDTVLVTIPGAAPERLDAVVRACSDAGIPCRFVRRDTDLDPLAVLGAAPGRP